MADNKTALVKEITPQSEDFSAWYIDVVRRAELADYSPVKGCMVIRPYGYAIWELIQKDLDARIKAAGRNKRYDCISGISGGVDSSYTAYLANQLGLRPLIVHFQPSRPVPETNRVAVDQIVERKVIQSHGFTTLAGSGISRENTSHAPLPIERRFGN